MEAEWSRLNLTDAEKHKRKTDLLAADLAHKREVRAANEPAFIAAKVAKQQAQAQFEICDERSLDEVVNSLMTQGFVPSWCTACYRLGRTGQKFMKIAKR
jgi:hypothetical protein